jgi:hypothetical protein
MVPAPKACPLCGAEISKHFPESDEDLEHWVFMCDAEIVRDENGKLMEEEACGDAMRKAIERLNAAAA